MKIPIHSTTDLITNSSTVIFTYSESSESAVVQMIDEVFAAFDIDKKCEDVFDTVVLTDKYRYGEGAPEGFFLSDQLYDDVLAGKTPKPDWFNDVESFPDHIDQGSYDYYSPSTYLHLIPKKEEYKKLATLIKKFLYSTDHEATRD